MPEKNVFNSEELHEVIGQEPSGIIKWSLMTFLIIITIIVAAGYWIQYSDVVNGKIVIMANDAPKAVIARIDGKVLRLLLQEENVVRKGDIIAYMESTADHAEVLKLSSALANLQTGVGAAKWEVLNQWIPDGYSHLGEMQIPFQLFMESFIQLQSYLENGFYIQKKAMLEKDIRNNIALGKRLMEQRSIIEKDYLIASQEFVVKEQLYKEKVLPLLEYKQEESRLLNKQLPVEAMKSSMLQQEGAVSGKQEELLQLDQQVIQQKKAFLQALSTLISELNRWKMQYLLIAPSNGTLTFPALLQDNQDVKPGQELCYIVPSCSEYYGELTLTQENSGKVKPGQQVFIKLSGYPPQEFGRLTGHISFIASVPDKNKQYIAKVILHNGMRTEYGYKPAFKHAMTADADIVTDKSRLIYKFLYTLRYIWNKSR
jgi:HlyD family secretion protein